jgi:L-rhamnose isomerase
LKEGEPWSPQDFVEQAEAVTQPFDTLAAQDAILRNAFSLLTAGPEAMADARASVLEHWKRRAEELEPQELELRNQMHTDVRPIMATRRILLFGKRCTAADVPKASELCHQLASSMPPLCVCVCV